MPHPRREQGRNTSARRLVTPYAPRRRRSRRGALIGAVVLVVLAIVAGLIGCAKLEKPTATSAPAAATPAAIASSAATNAAALGATSSANATRSAGTSSSAGASGATATSTGIAWRDADPAWMDKYRGKLVLGFRPESGYKGVALTFDDGPNGETQYVIDQLKKYDGQATFFDTGRKLMRSWAVAQPALIWKAGFELGNHTQHHTIDNISSMWHRTYAVDLAEIQGPDVFAKRGTGRNTIWLRPMGGEIDATGVKAAADTDHLVINWTIDSNDSHGGPRTPDYIFNTVTSSIKPGDVVLMHVTHPESMTALPRITAYLASHGFKMVTVTELAQHSTPITGKIPPGL